MNEKFKKKLSNVKDYVKNNAPELIATVASAAVVAAITVQFSNRLNKTVKDESFKLPTVGMEKREELMRDGAYALYELSDTEFILSPRD